MRKIEQHLRSYLGNKPLEIVGLWNATTPVNVLEYVFSNASSVNAGENSFSIFTKFVLKYAISIKHVQKARRCLRLISE